MVGSTWESSVENPDVDGRPRCRSDSGQPWDERPASNTNNTGSKISNANSSTTMRRDHYGSNYTEEELEDGDLPRLNLTRSTSNGNDHTQLVGLNASTNIGIHHEILQKMAGGEEELKKQQAFWKQLDSPSTMTNDEDAVAADSDTVKRKRRFEKEKLAPGIIGPILKPNMSRPASKETPAADGGFSPEIATEPVEAPEDSISKEPMHNSRKGKSDAAKEIWSAESEESDNTKDSKEYVDADNDDANFCDHTLAAIEVLCGDAASMQAFCGGVPRGAPTSSNINLTLSNPSHTRNEQVCRRKQAKNLNILCVRDENDSVDEHTAIEVEYVEPEETSALAQERQENWSPTRKNAYLAAMARKAKEDFEKTRSLSPKRKPKAGATTPEVGAQDVYNSFNAAEKRKFLRLINSGMTPTESAQRVHAEGEKSRESKTSSKGKLFKFWKKGKSKKNANSNENEQQASAAHDCSVSPLVNTYQQEEKKEDEQHTTVSAPRLAGPKDVSSESASRLENVTGEDSQEYQTHSHSQSSCDNRHCGSGSDTPSTPPSKQSTLSSKNSEKSNNSGKPSVKLPVLEGFHQVEHLCSEKPVAGSAQHLKRSPLETPSMIASLTDAAKPHNLMNDSLLGNMNRSENDGTASDDSFAKSGINYYDAVRRDLRQSEDETKFSNQVSSKSKQVWGPRLGPILQSPKLQGFSRLTKGGSKANKVKEKYASSPPQVQEKEMSTLHSPGTLSDASGTKELCMLEQEKARVDDSSRDYLLTKNVNEYGTANFEVLVRSSTKPLNSSIATPSKAEEEALERIEKELLRPVRNTGNQGPGDPTFKSSGKDIVTVDLSGCAPAVQSRTASKRFRDQVVPVVSPAKDTSTIPGSQFVPPTSVPKEVTPSKEITPTAASVASTAMLTPLSTPAFHTTGPFAPPKSDSLPSPAKLSPILASAAPTYLEAPHRPADEANSADVEPTQEDLDSAMQDYLSSTEVYSQPGQAHDSLSVVSGRSFTTADSVHTQGSTPTQSSRKRRPGAAQKRLDKAKEAEKQAVKKKGWHESIQAAAESTNRVWKPKVGWVDYNAPLFEGNTAELFSSVVTEKMHLNLPLGKRHQEDTAGDYCLAKDQNSRFQQEEPVVDPPKNCHQDVVSVPDVEPDEDACFREYVSHTAHPEVHPASKQVQAHIGSKSSSKMQQRVRNLDGEEQVASSHFVGEIKCEMNTSSKASSLLSHTNSEGRRGPNISKPDLAVHVERLPERAAPVLQESINPGPDKQLEEVAHLSVNTRFPALEEKLQETLPPVSVDADCRGLDDSYLDVSPAPEPDNSQSFGAVNTPIHREKPISLSLDEMSMDESIAHSVDQFVRSISAASPSKSGRKKCASSPNRTQRFSTSPSKKSGWVDSMRAATANIGKEQSWDPLTGWALSDSAFGRNESSENFAPASTRFEQETIEERQTEVSERLETHSDESPGLVEPSYLNEAVHDKEGKDQVQRQGMGEHTESTIPAERSLQPLYPPAQRPAELGTGCKWKQEEDVSLLCTEGGFPCPSPKITPTVEVVKEKVDKEEMSWFPRSRRSSSMIVIEESPEKEDNSATSLAGTLGRNGGAGCLQADGRNDTEGVLWNGVVFESGPHSQPTLLEKKKVAPQAMKLSPGGVSEDESAATNHSKTDAPRSALTISSKNSFPKVVPKLSQCRRDTSPIRAKAGSIKDRQINHDLEQPSHNSKHPRSDIAPGMSSSSPPPPPPSEKNQVFSQGEHVRASRSVWRSTALAVSPGNSPNTCGIIASLKSNSAQSTAMESCPPPIGIAGGQRCRLAQSALVVSPPRPNGVGLSQDNQEVKEGTQPGHKHFRTDNGDPPSVIDTPASPGVRTRAQEWESRLPKDNVGHEAKQRHHTNSSGRLNSATAEWKSFLGKKVQAESVAAAGDQLCLGETMDVQARHDCNGTNDSLFDFHVTDGSVDSKSQSPQNTTWQGQDARVQHNDDVVPEAGRPQQEGIIPQCHQGAMAKSGFGGHPAASKERQHAPTEISEHSDGSQVNKPFLVRLAGCAAPMMRKGSQQGTDALVHLAFLRPNPPEDKNANSTFVPQYFCGRPDVILEEANEGDEGDNSIEEKKVTERDERQPMKNPQVQGSQAFLPTRVAAEARADSHSVISEDFGAKTAYLEALAMKTAISKPRRSDSRRWERSSVASDVSSNASKLQQKERWRDFLDRKWNLGASPGKSRAGSDTTASAAENYAAKKVDEMMAIMSRSKSTPRNWRADDDPEKSKSQFVDNAIRELARDSAALPGEFGRRLHGRSSSLVAAEQLASARVNAMMQVLGNDNSIMEEGEI